MVRRRRCGIRPRALTDDVWRSVAKEEEGVHRPQAGAALLPRREEQSGQRPRRRRRHTLCVGPGEVPAGRQGVRDSAGRPLRDSAGRPLGRHRPGRRAGPHQWPGPPQRWLRLRAPPVQHGRRHLCVRSAGQGCAEPTAERSAEKRSGKRGRDGHKEGSFPGVNYHGGAGH
eukprot:scaffold75_cov217-Pinguiococcus_pyrenoidosus.AAC.5